MQIPLKSSDVLSANSHPHMSDDTAERPPQHHQKRPSDNSSTGELG